MCLLFKTILYGVLSQEHLSTCDLSCFPFFHKRSLLFIWGFMLLATS